MLLSFRLSACLTAYVLALAISAVPTHEAFAQQAYPSSVETYVDPAASAPPPEGIYPEGMILEPAR